MDDWERRMEILGEYQQTLEGAANSVEQWLIAYREGRVPSLTPIPSDTRNLLGILANGLHQQVAFNKTVIQMLTDLDHRKSE